MSRTSSFLTALLAVCLLAASVAIFSSQSTAAATPSTPTTEYGVCAGVISGTDGGVLLGKAEPVTHWIRTSRSVYLMRTDSHLFVLIADGGRFTDIPSFVRKGNTGPLWYGKTRANASDIRVEDRIWWIENNICTSTNPIPEALR